MLGKDDISSEGPISPTALPSNPSAADLTDCTPAKRPCESLTQIDHILQPSKKPKIQQSKIIDSLSLSLPSVSSRDPNTNSHRPSTSNQHNSSPNKPLIELNSDDEDIVGLQTAHSAENQIEEESRSPPKKSTLIDYNSDEEFDLASNQNNSANREQINQGRKVDNDKNDDFDMDRLLDLEESMLEEEEHRSPHDSFENELQSENGQQRRSHGDIFDSDDEDVIKSEKANLMTQKKLNLEQTDEDMDELFGFRRESPQKRKPNPFMDKLNSDPEEPFNDRDSFSPVPRRRMTLKSMNVKKNYRIQPVTGSFISGISENGTQYYFPKKLPKPSASRDTGHMQSGNLLGSSIFNMLDQIEREERAKKQREDDELLIPLNDPLYAELNATTENRLWSDKYRPQSYHELIGDEVINREILLWVKEWDFCVFGDTKKSLKPKVRLTNLKKKNFKDAGDPLKRPDKKILLITGPPGLGKTTLANVIARQAGYNVVEINASDERTGSTIKDKLHNAIYNKSISNGSTNCKPNLVVIDEIDGVSGAGETNFIKLLVDLASVDVENESTETAKNKDKKKGFSRRPLTRPIICICNDHYVPVLRPLRSIAQIIQYRKPDITNLSTRLYDICQREGLKTDLRTLTGLCEVTDGDLRTCLNTLQFIRRKSTEFNISSLSNLNIGLKDSTKGLFTIWGEIFQLPNGKKRRNEILVKKNDQEGDVENESGRFIQRIVNLVQTCGEYDRLMNGCFENYPLIRFHDLGLQKINTGLDWILYYDTLHSKSFSAGGGGGNGMILNQYLPYCFAMFHKVWSSGYKPYLEFPRTDYEAFVEHRNNQNILTSFYNHIPPITRNRFTKDSLVLELLSYLARIVTPNMKSANSQVMRPTEKQSLKNLVQILVSFRITLVQEKIGEGQYGFRIEPPIDKIISWATTIGGLRSILPSQYAVRQMIAHEVDTEMYRKNDPEAEKKTKKKAKKTLSTPVTASQKIIEKAPVDFFGRPIPAAPESLDSQGNAKPEKLKVRIWYKFNEGYSNAVRKPITIREFLM